MARATVSLAGVVVCVGLAVFAAAGLRAQSAAREGDAVFTTGALRVDYLHSGGPDGEAVALDRLAQDGVWPGSLNHLLDETGFGHYRVEVTDTAHGRLVYSQGFSSMYAEWETTPEAKVTRRSFHESVRIPRPRVPVTVTLLRRVDGRFRPLWSTPVDPASRAIRPAPRPVGTVWTLFEHGPSATKVDLLVLGEGYTAAERTKFHADVARLVEAMFAVEPYRSRRQDFNVRAIDLAAPARGVSRPQNGITRRTAFGTSYDIFGTDRYMLAQDNRALRDVASAVPYDAVEVLVNEPTYGGGGIFGAHATVAVDSPYAGYVFTHEFAHHFAGLGDEYYSSEVAYATGAAEHPEPWEPNITALGNPATLKWRDLVVPGTPLPTPWDREAYEASAPGFQRRRAALRDQHASPASLDALSREQEDWQTAFLAALPYAGRVGAFEGASYEARGLFRPSPDCIMFSRAQREFCAVCRRAISRAIDAKSQP